MNDKNDLLSIAQVYSSWATSLKVEDIPKSVINKLNIILTIIYPTNLIIKTKIILIKSCKKINSSMIGELASCKPN